MARARALALVLLLGTAAPAGAGGPLAVVATSTDLQALVEAVGGEGVRVEHLAPPLQDPHTVEVKPGQLGHLRAAALLVRVGLDHEPWLAPALRSIGDPRFAPGSPHDLDLSRGIALLQTETARVRPERGGHVHGFGNPHYWLDPDNARPMTAAILEALARLAPGERSRFTAGRERFLAALGAGIERWQRLLEPVRGARVVVVHDTWPYFARRFGFTVVATVSPPRACPRRPRRWPPSSARCGRRACPCSSPSPRRAPRSSARWPSKAAPGR